MAGWRLRALGRRVLLLATATSSTSRIAFTRASNAARLRIAIACGDPGRARPARGPRWKSCIALIEIISVTAASFVASALPTAVLQHAREPNTPHQCSHPR